MGASGFWSRVSGSRKDQCDGLAAFLRTGVRLGMALSTQEVTDFYYKPVEKPLQVEK